MLDFKRKNKGIQKIYLKVIIVILAVLVLFAGNATWNLYLKYSEAKFNREIAQKELEKLQKREQDLLTELNKLSNDRGVEEELRKKFGIVREGEEVVVIVEAPEGSGTENSNAANKKGFFRNLLNIF